MDEIYRGYRIAVSQSQSWVARITAARGQLAPLTARSTDREGPEVCTARARVMIDRYIAFLDTKPDDDDPAS